MVLVHAAALVIIVIVSVIFLGRFFAKVVEILARYFARLDVSIDTFGLFSVRGIQIRLNGQRTLIIESISLQTKWTYSNSRKVFTILFGKTELIQSVQVGSQSVKDKTKKSKSFIASHSERLSRIINLLCQYLAISFCDVSVIVKLPRDKQIKCEIQQGLDVLANPNGKCLNCWMSAKKIETQITTINSKGLCDTLVKLTVESTIEASLQPLQGISSADVQVTLHSVHAVVNEGILSNNDNSLSPDSTIESAEDKSTRDEENESLSNTEPAKDIWLQLARIPKHMQVHVDKTCFSFVNRDQRKLNLDISQIVTIFEQKEMEDDLSKECGINLVISGVTATGIKSCELCKLNRLRFTSKLYEYNNTTRLGVSVCIESLHNNYVHDECIYWMEYLKSRLRQKKETKSRSSRGIEFKLPVKVDMEMIDCSTCLFLNHERADQPLCRAVLASCVVNADIPRMGLDTDNETHRIRMETRVENAYIYFDALKTLPESFDSQDTMSYTLPDNPALLPNTNNHVWGRTLAMGSFALQCDVEMPVLDNKTVNIRMKAEANCLTVEWSHQVCSSILHLTKQFTTIAMTTTYKSNEDTPHKTKICMDSEIKLRGVNILYLGTRENGVDSFVYRTDMVVVTMPVSEPASLEAFGLSISRMIGLKKAPYKCLLSGDISDPCLSAPAITVLVTKDKIISCSVNDTLVNWDPTLHMALNDRLQEIIQDIASVKGTFVQRIESKGDKNANSTMTQIKIKCDISAFKLDMKTSSSTRFGVQLTKSAINLQAGDLSVAMETAAVLFDDNKTFTFKNVNLQKASQVEEVQNVRKEFSNLTTSSNITWIIAAQETHIYFPDQFDFASSRSELVNIAKMLKTLHRKPRDSSYIGSLPPDLWLRFGKIVFEIEDDPFEVKLGVNYTLLLDEAKHWTDRMETLQNRLNTIRMTPGNLLTVQKEIMLHRKLLEKNAELYIQRSKAFYQEFPMRTSLLVWELEGLDLIVLADESYHGKPNAVETMTRLNTESPFPGSDMDFSTLWCRTVKGTLASQCVKLRDYPQSIFTSKGVRVSGTFLAAEQAARDIAKYDSKINVEKPWDDLVVQRSLTVLKYYYDLDFDVDTLELAWGVDTEPALAMVSLAFERLSKPSKDPSKPLPFYDKIRLLLHGRLHMDIKKWLMFFSAARNPYERTERMEVDWSNVDLLWTNGHIEIVGDFDLQTRTASRYDDRQVLHLPAFKVCADMLWNCTGNPNDHFNVMPFAPSKLPELAPNQVHDTYAAFRSQNLSLHISLETAMIDRTKYNNQGPPNVCLYASTFRWFKKYQEVVLRYTSRPIKRGKYFKRIPVKKKALGRHYKEVSLSLKFPELSVWYWGSFSQQRGFEVKCGLGSLHTQYRLALRPFDGELARRPAADWTATKLHVQIRQITCHLYGVEQADGQVEGEETEDVSSIDLEPTKYYFLTTESLEYYRQDSSKQPGSQSGIDEPDSQSYNHQLVCHGSKGVWTLTNRRIIFGLFEAYTNAEVLKKNLSADALKITIVEKKQKTSPVSPDVSTMKPRSMSLLQKLVSEKDSKFTVFTEEGTGTVEPSETALQGVALCSIDDVISHTWHIKLVNSQILLQGTETKGGVLVTAGNTTVLNRLHRPVWSKTELLNKKTWVGKLENLQYFATVSPEDSVNLNNIPWLDISVITGRQAQEKTGFDIANLANIVGSGEAVGGVVTAIVGGATGRTGQDVPQLQRIVARCGCEFYFVNFSSELDPLAESMTPNLVPQSPASSNHLRVNRLPTVDTYTIRHKLLEISTNSSQYLMLIDIVNNVVLYTEPKKKEAIERLQKMTFRLQLSAIEDQRGQILKQQNIVRSHQGEMKILQRDLYELNLMRKQALDNQELIEAMVELERNITNKKELLNSASTELKLLISAYKDFQMNLSTPTPEKAPSARADPTKLAEVHFNHVSWQLNQADGQLEIADVAFRNFSYSKTTLSDATIEHRFEIPKFNVRNLLPNSIYKDVLMQNSVSGQDRSVMVRLYCRVKPPVAGIGIKEHLEVNVCPLSVGLTHRLFSKIMVFFFPQRAHEYESEVTDVDLIYRGGADQDEKDFGDDDLFTADDLEDVQLKTSSLKRYPSTSSSISSSSDTSLDSSKSKKNLLTSHTDSSPSSPGAKDKGKKKSTFYRPLEEHDDLEKMKERASKNHSFIYVKVTEVLLCVSYKGEKEKNIVDVHNFNLTLPTLEYHNRTWTWHDLLIAMKKDCINVLVSQIIKEKLHLKGAHGMEGKDAKSQPREEDKAKLLFGDRSKIEKKKSKKSLLGKLVKKTLNPKHSGLLQPDGAGPEPVNLEGEVYQQRSDEEEQEPEEPSQGTQ